MTAPRVARPKPPSPLAAQLVRAILWFGVGVAAGLAPFLGKLPFPGFSALLEIYPEGMKGWLIPLSGFLMGVVAVWIEFLGVKLPSQAFLRRWFQRSLIAVAAAFVALLLLYPYLVTRAAIEDGSRYAAFVTGTDRVPLRPPGSPCDCPEGQSAEECIGDAGLTLGHVRECFGSRRVTVSTQGLAVLYLLMTGGFASTVGFLVLLKQKRPAAKSSRGAATQGP